MAQSDLIERASAVTLGGPGPADPARCSQAAIEALSRAAGAGMRLTSLALDLAAQPMGQGDVAIRTRVDKRTRAIVFVSMEARAGDAVAFSAQGLFSPAEGSR